MSESDLNPQSQTSLGKLLPWIVLLLSALGLFYFVEKGCGAKPVTMESPKTHVDTMQTKPISSDTIDADSIH